MLGYVDELVAELLEAARERRHRGVRYADQDAADAGEEPDQDGNELRGAVDELAEVGDSGLRGEDAGELDEALADRVAELRERSFERLEALAENAERLTEATERRLGRRAEEDAERVLELVERAEDAVACRHLALIDGERVSRRAQREHRCRGLSDRLRVGRIRLEAGLGELIGGLLRVRLLLRVGDALIESL